MAFVSGSYGAAGAHVPVPSQPSACSLPPQTGPILHRGTVAAAGRDAHGQGAVQALLIWLKAWTIPGSPQSPFQFSQTSKIPTVGLLSFQQHLSSGICELHAGELGGGRVAEMHTQRSWERVPLDI